jgi:thiamine pyrophosphate-dependent acetolactate synthase large subunit-like protein
MAGSGAAWVSDAVVDLLVEAGIEYVAFNPGATFRGIHDSLVNYRADAPRVVLCAHEGISVSVAHGYAKASGRPMAALVHDVVGLQHASMAIYNAWCDRVPMLIMGGTGPLSTVLRRPWIDWIHTANVQAEQVRNYVKWDDQPADAASIPRAFARALGLMRAEPTGPVYMCLDAELQETPWEGSAWPSLDRFPVPSDPALPESELHDLADRLREARMPVLISDYAGDTEVGYQSLVRLAELLQAPLVDRGARHNAPVDHGLNFTELPDILGEADLIVAVEVEDLYGALAAAGLDGHPVPAEHSWVVHVTTGHLRARSWTHAIGELPAVERELTASAATALPALIRRLEREPPPEQLVKRRRDRLAGRVKARREALWREAQSGAAHGAVHPARLAAEAWEALAPDAPLLVHSKPDDWERRLWPLAGFRAHLGWHGGGGLGYGLGASIGAAIGLRHDERLLVDLQPDGDLLYAPAALWTAASLSTPMLVLVQNNRQYRNTVEHAARVAERRGRPLERRYAGASLAEPPIDYAALARSFGVWGAGPLHHVEDVAPALREAASIVRGGRPAVVEVVTSGA